MAEVNKEKCVHCGGCINMCPVGAISFDVDGAAKIDESKCVNCGTCKSVCPMGAIE